MKPGRFAYLAPGSLAEALGALSAHGADAKLLAGGQSLVPMMNFRLACPALLVDCNGISELAGIRPRTGGGLALGAMTRQRQLERDPQVAARAPLLAAAMPHIAHPQIRNRGTLGGSVAHADPAAELPAVMVALDAHFELQSARNSRQVKAQDFFLGLLTTALEPDEMLVEVVLPPWPPTRGWAFLEVARRHGDYAQVGIAAWLDLEPDGRCREAQLVYLSVGDVPLRAPQAAALLRGQELTPAALAAAAELAAQQEIEPTSDIHASALYKRHLARVLTVRALEQAAARAHRAGGGPHG